MLELLYNLKECLEFSALGGVNLINQDFRLKKALGEFKEISVHSKVLTKIYDGIEEIINKDCTEKAVKLLNVLALINAVIVTQLETTSNNKLETPQVFEREYLRIPSKSMTAFNNAIYEKGSGKLKVLEDFLEDGSKLNDFRVFNGVMNGLKNQGTKSFLVNKLIESGDKEIATYLGQVNRNKNSKDIISEAQLLYMCNKMNDGCEDEHIKNIYRELNKETGKKKSKINYAELVSIITNNKENFEFFKDIYKNNDVKEVSIVKLIQMSEKYGKNYINDITEEIIEYEFNKNNGDNEEDDKATINIIEDGRAIIYSTDSRIADIFLDKFEAEMNKKIGTSKKELEKTNSIRFMLLYLCINKPNDRWFKTMLEYIKKGTFFSENKEGLNAIQYSNPACKFLLTGIVIEYVLVNNGNINNEFLEEVYNLIGKHKIWIQFVIDLQEKSSDYVFETYSPYFTKSDRYVALGLLETIYDRVHYDVKNNKYALRSIYYSYILVKNSYTKHYNRSELYQKMMEDEYNFKRESLEFFDKLDPRWYELLLDTSATLYSSFKLSRFYMENFDYPIGLDKIYQVNYFDQNFVITLINKEEVDTIKSIAEKIYDSCTKASGSSRYYKVNNLCYRRFFGDFDEVYDIIDDELKRLSSERENKEENKKEN